MTILFVNFAKSTLAAPLNPGDTTATLATGTGGLFPSPTGGDYFVLVLTDHVTKTNHEVIHCTARSGDSLTVVRGREGTTDGSWIVADIVQCAPTAGQQAAFAQLAGPNTFAGINTFPDQSAGNNTGRAANTKFVQSEFTAHKASQPQTDAGTAGDIYVSPVTLRFGFAISLSTGTGGSYIKFPSWMGGLVLQFGRTASLAGASNVTVTFPFASMTANYACFAFRNGASNANQRSDAINSYSTTQMVIDNGSPSSAATFSWLVIGGS